MNKSGGSTVFMLGVAGMGLAIAMFFDAKKTGATVAAQNNPTRLLVRTEEIHDKFTPRKEEEPQEESEHTEPPKVPEEHLDVIIEDEDEEDTKSDGSKTDYKQLYLDAQQREMEDLIKDSPDNSYKGDGTAWSKKIYFIKEAYRRSREATPVDPLIKQRVKYAMEPVKKLRKRSNNTKSKDVKP